MNKIQICLASNNAHKVKEIQEIFGEKFKIITLEDIGYFDEIEETGHTFEENAFIKADCIYKKYKINVLSDDSGLEVEGLDNRPGVYSARFAGEPTNHEKNISKVLSELGENANRNARFVTVMALILNGQYHFFEGEIKGTITLEPKGKGGFGYDPIFIPNGYTQTFAELSSIIKNSISHRAKAVSQVLDFIKSAKK